MRKKQIILIIISILILLWLWIRYYDDTRCKSIQRRCTMYDLTTIENEEDLEFYRWLNEKCAGKCWIQKIKLDIKKRRCRYQYKKYIEHSKNRKYFKADIYNPCPELYTLPELNNWVKGK